MSEKQTHTQGPWVVKHDEKGLPFIGVESDPWTYNGTIASVNTSDKDARLIAAAPEMYEVLKEIFRLSEIGLSNGILYGKKLVTEMGTENIPTHEKVRAILDKVEGETV